MIDRMTEMLSSLVLTNILLLLVTLALFALAEILRNCRDYLYGIQDFAERLNMVHGLTDEQFEEADRSEVEKT